MSSNILVFCFLCASLLLSQTNAKSLSIAKIGKQCAESTGVDPNLVNRVTKNEAVENDDKYKDFLVCSYTYQGYFDPTSNGIVHDKIAKFLSQFYTLAETTYVVNGCKAVQHKEAKELVYQTLDCLLKKLHDVEAMQAKQAQNENDSKNNEI